MPLKLELGKIEILDPRLVWGNEEKDFTPWLSENIEELSRAIGIPISIDQIEKKVGSFELDIYGKVEGSDKVVVIENQLGSSDHGHLGQLLTYASGLGASVVVWVTPQCRDEHKTAIEWLNSVSTDRVSFFLVRPEVIRIDGSKPGVRFYLEAGPSEFVEGIRNAVEESEAPRHAFRRMFWEEMFAYLADHGHPSAKGRRTTKDSWVAFSAGKSGIETNVSTAQGSRIRVEVYLNSSSEQNQLWYGTLMSNQSSIEAKFSPIEVSWEPLEDARASRVAVYLAYDKAKAESDPAYRVSLYDWIGKQLTQMRAVAKEYLIGG